MSLEQTFSEDNFLKYSNACVSLADGIYELRQKEDSFNTLIIPSRGAVPFFLGMIHTIYRKAKRCKQWNKFYYDIGVHDMLEPLISTSHDIARKPTGKELRVLLAPFTADLNISASYPGEDNNEYTAKTREYWARVIVSFFKHKSDKLQDPYFKSFMEILSSIEGREGIAEVYKEFAQIRKAVIIDTVISGRAANDILSAFDRLAEKYGNSDLKPHAFLVIDENGEVLKRNYRFDSYLRSKENEGLAKLIKIPNILSEDKGAALEGVIATVYPSIMKASKSLRSSEDSSEFFIGAGSWHIIPRNSYMKCFQDFIDVVYAGIDVDLGIEMKTGPDVVDRFLTKRKLFLEKYGNGKELNQCNNISVADLNFPFNLSSMDEPYSTSSYVLHIPLVMQETNFLINKICTSTGAKIYSDAEKQISMNPYSKLRRS